MASMSAAVVFRWTRRTIGFATGMLVVAMFLYPGGTFADHSTRGYSFTHNFLSDLGATVTVGGHSNAPSATLFVASLVLMMGAFGVSLGAVVRVHSKSPAARPYAWAAAAVGILVCLLFLGVAVSPEDRAFRLHVEFARWAFRISPVAVLMLAFATRRDPDFPPVVTNSWLLLTVALAVYVAVMAWGPNAGTEFGLGFQATAQKAIVIVADIVIVFETYEAERVLGQRKEHPPATPTP
jgi:hypothetical membrane protein